jgi:hypothetical protein
VFSSPVKVTIKTFYGGREVGLHPKAEAYARVLRWDVRGMKVKRGRPNILHESSSPYRPQFCQNSQGRSTERLSLTRYWPDDGKKFGQKPLDDFDTT